MKFSIGLLLALLLFANAGYTQSQTPPKEWFHLNAETDTFPGISSNKSYQELLNKKQGQTVVVAVLDSGVDAEHEDLRDIMWVNEDEIPGNGIDDDNNGYVDDVHGWNFIGNASGENIHHDNLEAVRLLVKYEKRFEGVDPSKLSKKEKADYEEYQEIKEEVDEKRTELAQNVMLYSTIADAFAALEKDIGKSDITLDELNNYEPEDPMLQRVVVLLNNLMADGQSYADISKEIKDVSEYFYNRYHYHYNKEYDPRELVDDDYSDKEERYYGNNDVEGPDAEHGTHVAGIIGAIRDNGLGMDGIADNVRIMSVRTVPDGDERDKDVANAIRYAVENGATVINMSFGKGYSPYKPVVDEAVRFAVRNDVLLVHAAGNDSQLNTVDNTFPNDTYRRKGFFNKLFGSKYADSWIEVGALSWEEGEGRAAVFSNYSPREVDIFAPGVDIYSTIPDDEYENNQGTSMAAPVVAGVAAVLRSYFPDLTAEQVKAIILQSAQPQKGKVLKPGTQEKVPFSQLCLTGGAVDLYKAILLAAKTKGKKKGKSRVITAEQLSELKAPNAVP